jgi:two-component system, sensor histidine kinase YesM
MRALRVNLKRWLMQIFADAKISTRIMLFYGSLLVFSVLLSSVIYQNVYQGIISQKVSAVSMQTVYSIGFNIDTMIENAKNLSKVIITSDEIQNPLKSNAQTQTTSADPSIQRAINAHISRFIDGFPFISAIYIFDNTSQRYGVDKFPLKALNLESIEDALWYNEAVKAGGGYLLRINSGGVLSEATGDAYVSLIRIINDIYLQEPIGVLILNITQDAFAQAYLDIQNNYETDIMIVDESGQIVVNFRNNKLINAVKLPSTDKTEGSGVQNIDGRDYLVSYLKMPNYSWRIISVMPFEELSRESAVFYGITITIIAFNAILLFFGVLIISRMITKPINKLLISMKGVERGVFEHVDIPAGNNEIGRLRDAYNIMIEQIANLIARVVNDEKLRRKGELDVLQAQIKPHFLYNTFDAISALALSGRNDEVYQLMKALGSYYRISLSKGSEIITVGEEIEVVKNYLAIQKVRYGDIFNVHYELDELANPAPILKLILQPLVENALYHGIKPKGTQGNIWVNVRRDEDIITLSVRDDGVGMSQELIQQIMEADPAAEKRTSFGLRGTLERLRLFYGSADPMHIESVRGEGTQIVIRIPARREGVL